jgi:hypothetical protein
MKSFPTDLTTMFQVPEGFIQVRPPWAPYELSFGGDQADNVPPPKKEWEKLDKKLAFRPFLSNGLCVVAVEERRKGSQAQLKHTEWNAALREMARMVKY